MENEETLTGSLSEESTFIGELIGNDVIQGSLSNGVKETEHYSGPYSVIPGMVNQELLTIDKMMDNNVVVMSIPYYQVGNSQNGETFVIGG